VRRPASTPARNLLASAALLSAGPALAAKKPLAAGERVDLNRASAAELMRLPGVGRGRARAIVEQRARQPFRGPEEVIQVKGISLDWYEKVKDHLAASGGGGASRQRSGGALGAGGDPSANR
jgi:competence protein ComEA